MYYVLLGLFFLFIGLPDTLLAMSQQEAQRSSWVVAKANEDSKNKAQSFASGNVWYQPILAVVQKTHGWVMPDQGLIFFCFIAFDKALETERAQEYLRLLCTAIKEFKSEIVCVKIFDYLSEQSNTGWMSVDQINDESLKQLFINLEAVLCSNCDSKARFAQSFVRWFKKYYYTYQGSCDYNRLQLATIIVNFFKKYAKYDKEGFSKVLHDLLDYHVNASFPDRLRCKAFFMFLGLLQAEDLETYITKKIIGNDKFSFFIQGLFINRSEANALPGIATLLQYLVTSDLNERHNAKALGAAFCYGDESFYNLYKGAIKKIVPQFLEDNFLEYLALFQLAQRPSDPKLRKLAMNALVQYVVNPAVGEDWRNRVVGEFFKENNLTMQERCTAYRLMESAYQESDWVIDLQALWKRLILKIEVNAETKNLLFNSVMSYYKVSPLGLGMGLDVILAMAFKDFLNTVLQLALDKKTITAEKMHISMQAAQVTGLARYINPGILTQQADSIIFNRKAAFVDRIACLDQRLLNMDASQLAAFERELQVKLFDSNEELCDLDFQNYCFNIYKALNPAASLFVRRTTKIALQAVCGRYGYNFLPKIVAHLKGMHLNYFCKLQGEEPVGYIPVDRDFAGPQVINEGLMYGFQPVPFLYAGETTYRFVACDTETLEVVWEFSCNDTTKPPYAISDTHVYLAQGDRVLIFDKNTGERSHSHSVANGLPIVFIGVCASGLLCVAHGNGIAFLDCSTGECNEKFMGPESWKSPYDTFCIVGNVLMHYWFGRSYMTLYHVDEQNDIQKMIIDTVLQRNEGGLHWSPEVMVKNDFLYYKRCPILKSYELVCFDAKNYKEVWSYPLPADLLTKEGVRIVPCISADGSKLFIFTDQKIIALNTAVGLNVAERLLWAMQLGDAHNIDQLMAGPDETILYGMGTRSGKLYKINAATGECALTATVKGSSLRRFLIGISSAGLPLTQSNSY